GSGLLASLLALKFLEVRRLRDCMVAVFLCYLLLLTSFLYSQTPWLAFYSVLAILASIATLIRLNQPAGADLRYSLRVAGMLVVKAVPLMLAMFILFPRIQGSLWNLPADAYATLTGLSETMEPGSVRALTVSTAPAFRVEFQGPAPPMSQLYWRSMVLWHTDGKRWSRGARGSGPPPVLGLRRREAPVRYTVTLEPSNKPWLPALDLPLVIPRGARARHGHIIEHRSFVRERLEYTLVSSPVYETGDLDGAERERALQLPEHVSDRVRALAQQWRRASSDHLTIVRAALDYFRREPFYYTLKPPPVGEDPVDEFLFETRRGFCGYFASAFVTLMRLAGIPSRIVQGYQGAEYNPAGKYWIVRQAYAHAWAEIWAPGRGWLRIDPTAAVAPERVELGIEAVRQLELRGVQLGLLSREAVRKLIELGWFADSWRTVRFYWDAANIAWHRSILSFDHRRQQHLLSALKLPQLSGRGLLAALVAVLTIALLLLAVTTRRRPKPDPVQAAYRRFCARLSRIGVRRTPAEGALAFAVRASAERPDLKQPVQAITQSYLRLRYANLGGHEQVRALKRMVAEFHP
ncbi:MAG: DUF3488 and DUF4129 domain-containing transglutaminase family protein, partial [Acidiferrobacterales bacterium]